VLPALVSNPVGSSQSFWFLDVSGRFPAQPVWDQIGLDDTPPHTSATGADVTVAVIDTGIAAHPFLAGSIEGGGYNFVDLNTNTADVADTLDNNQNGIADEFAGHGTMIAGLIRAVAPQSSLLPIRVMDDEGRCDTFKLVAGIYHAITANADIINLSLGTIDPSDVLRAAIQNALSNGTLVVAAAGNDDRSEPLRFPAGFVGTGLFAVAACDELDIRAPFSNWGRHIVITAPGVDITSTILDGQYGRGSGTSLSAPLIAGTLARLRNARPTATAAELRTLLTDAATDLDALNPSYVGELGAGRLEVAAAVTEALGLADLNCDGTVTVSDIGPFVLALTNPAQYMIENPNCDIIYADINGDTGITVSDIGSFVTLLIKN
ncbi:MAG: S8 family serine peptidase, partial [Phycisphaerae bacterium]